MLGAGEGMTAPVTKNGRNGCRGIPGPGRPKGSKDKTTKLKEAVHLGNREYYLQQVRENGRAIIDRFIMAAKHGQPWAIQIFMEREFGKVKEFVEVSTPDTTLTVKVVEVKQ